MWYYLQGSSKRIILFETRLLQKMSQFCNMTPPKNDIICNEAVQKSLVLQGGQNLSLLCKSALSLSSLYAKFVRAKLSLSSLYAKYVRAK